MTGIYERLIKAECDEQAALLFAQKMDAAQPLTIYTTTGSTGHTRTYTVAADDKVQPAD